MADERHSITRRTAFRLAGGAAALCAVGAVTNMFSPLFGFGAAPSLYINTDYTWTEYDCSYFDVTDGNGDRGRAYCLDHNITTPGSDVIFYDGVSVRESGWYSEYQCKMLDYIAYHAYSYNPGNDMLYAAWAVWNVVHGEGYRDITDIYTAAKNYANNGGGGVEAGSGYVYNRGGASQPILYGVPKRYGDLYIDKVVEGPEADANQAFSFHVWIDGVVDEDISLSANDTPKHYENIPAGKSYRVTETPASGYTLSSLTNASGTIGDGATVTVVGTNRRDSGSIEVKKVVVGAATSERFSFRMIIKRPDGSLYVDETFSLGHNETKTYVNVPTGYNYEVTETSVSLYTTTWLNRTGTIIKDTQASVVCTNTRYGHLTVVKNSSGNGSELERNRAFSFTVTFAGDNAPATATFSLKAGESKGLDIPAGVTATVTENADDYYSSTWAGGTHVVTMTPSGNVTVTANNVRKTGNLRVSKQLSGNGSETGHMFTFDVLLRDLNGNLVNSTFNGRTFTNGVYSFTMSAGTSPTEITGLPYGYSYVVSERSDANYDIDSKSGDNGTISNGGWSQVTFVNRRKVGYTMLEKRLDM